MSYDVQQKTISIFMNAISPNDSRIPIQLVDAIHSKTTFDAPTMESKSENENPLEIIHV